MCGITGFIDFKRDKDSDTLFSIVDDMAGSLAHRGPDDHSSWVDPKTGVALGHRRLSVIDLSDEGRQPMTSPSGRYVIVYNGEVYNFNKIRKELESYGFEWRGHSDTEVILGAIETWGIRKALDRFIGMFALAVWGREERRLILVRDRLGIKPLYYGWAKNNFIFGSEMKALRRHPEFLGSVDRNSLALFFRHNYVPAPYSIYKDIKKLLPGEMLVLELGGDGKHSNSTMENSRYWNLNNIWRKGELEPYGGSEIEVMDELESRIKDAVELRMISDVPLGGFLSGGIDSSLIVAIMQSLSSLPVNTFTIGFEEKEFDEAQYAKKVAEHLGTNHHEFYVSPQELLDVVPEIPVFWDEPFSDASQIPTYILSKIARRHVTVCLSGDGGDELFSGYQRYFWANSWQYVKKIPYKIRQLIAYSGMYMPEFMFYALGSKGPKYRWRLPSLMEKDFPNYYLSFISHNNEPASIVLEGYEYQTELKKNQRLYENSDLFHVMSYWDLISYLPDDILTKVDRASMAVSLELRVPLLDHRIVEFASGIPTGMKTKENKGKQIFRKLLKKYIPENLIERPKKGFSVPIEKWLKNELKEWAQDLLDEKIIKKQGYLNAPSIKRIWDEYTAGRSNWYYCIWDVLMFQAWLQKNE